MGVHACARVLTAGPLLRGWWLPLTGHRSTSFTNHAGLCDPVTWEPRDCQETAKGQAGLILVTRSGSESDLSFYSRSYGIIVQGLISSSVKIDHLNCIKPSKLSLTLLILRSIC